MVSALQQITVWYRVDEIKKVVDGGEEVVIKKTVSFNHYSEGWTADTHPKPFTDSPLQLSWVNMKWQKRLGYITTDLLVNKLTLMPREESAKILTKLDGQRKGTMV